MLIPQLHFNGDCKEAIAMYEKAFKTKAKPIIRKGKDLPDGWVEGSIVHAVMDIFGHKVFLNDRFGNKNKSMECAVKLTIQFKKETSLLECYETMKDGSIEVDPMVKKAYSGLTVQFIDKFGVQWMFMINKENGS